MLSGAAGDRFGLDVESFAAKYQHGKYDKSREREHRAAPNAAAQYHKQTG